MSQQNENKIVTSHGEIGHYMKKIKCPLHHRVLPGKEPYEIVMSEWWKDSNLSDADCKRFGVKKWRYKKDRQGNKIPNYKNHFQPEIPAALAFDNVYDPDRPICQKCRRCCEGTSRSVYGKMLRRVGG